MATGNRNYAHRLYPGFNTGTGYSAGCELIFQEKASGGRWDRPELQRLLQQLREGDQVIVWKLDRLSITVKGIGDLFSDLLKCYYPTAMDVIRCSPFMKIRTVFPAL